MLYFKLKAIGANQKLCITLTNTGISIQYKFRSVKVTNYIAHFNGHLRSLSYTNLLQKQSSKTSLVRKKKEKNIFHYFTKSRFCTYFGLFGCRFCSFIPRGWWSFKTWGWRSLLPCRRRWFLKSRRGWSFRIWYLGYFKIIRLFL